MALCTTAFTLYAGTRSRRSPSDEGLAAVLAGSAWPLDGDVPVQARSADQAAAPVNVTELVLVIRGKNSCRVNYRLSYLRSAESTVREGVRPAKSIDASGKNG